jgi:hypothetical protein
MKIESSMTEFVTCIRLALGLTDDQAAHIGEALQAQFAGRRLYIPARAGNRHRNETLKNLALRIRDEEGARPTEAADLIASDWSNIPELKGYKPVSSRHILRIVSEAPPPAADSVAATLDTTFCHWH